MLKTISDLSKNINDDFVTLHYVQDLAKMSFTAMTDPGFCKRNDFIGQKSEMIRRGRELFGAKYMILASQLIDQVKAFVDGLSSDSSTMHLVEDVLQMNNDLFIDS